MPENKLGPCILEGVYIQLIPLKIEHKPELLIASQESDFSWLQNDVRTPESMNSWFSEMISEEKEGYTYPFAVQVISTGKIIGTARYMDISTRHKRVEIGGTWYMKEYWGTSVNPEAKYLLLKHAFEEWHANRVQLKTDSNNLHSQKAIMKLGAKFEGRLRNHMVRKDGTVRDTMMYSITSQEWLKVGLELKSRVLSTKPIVQ